MGVPGASNWKPHYRRLFDDYERVIVIGDGDTAGRQFASMVAGHVPAAIVRPMPADEDVSSFVTKHGAEAFREYLNV